MLSIPPLAKTAVFFDNCVAEIGDNSFEKFMEMHQAEAELQIPDIGKNADIKIENNGSKEAFYQEVKKVTDLI